MKKMLYNVIYITIFISILITNSYSKPVKQSKNESERCCWAKQFSADVSLSTNIRLSDGTIEEIHVRHFYTKFFLISTCIY